MTCSVFARILFFASLVKPLYASNGSIEIERRDINYTNGKATYRPDTFKIPSTMCSSDIPVYCGVMGGHSVGGCKCECNSEETTFGFYDDQWNCTANSKVRQEGGCSLILLSNRTEDSALITVPLNIRANIDYLMPTYHQRCYIIPYNSTYLLCDGSWKKLSNNFVFERFSMEERNKTQLFTFRSTKSDFGYNEVKGRILRMTIGCYNDSNAIIGKCLLLKMQGTMKCSQFFLPPLPTMSLPTTSLPTPSLPTTSLPTTSLPTTSLPTTSLPTSPWTIPPTSETGTSGNELQTHSIRTSLSLPTTVKSPSFADKRKKNGAEENDGGDTGLIAGVAVGVIGITLIIVAIVIIKRRRTKRNTAAPKSNTTLTVENVSYDLGADNSLKITDYNSHRSLDQDEYSYAYANAVPLDRRNMSNGPPNNQGPQITVSNHVYGKVEELDKQGSPSHPSAAPASKILEAPVYAEVNKPKRRLKNTTNSDGPKIKGINPQKSIDSQKEPLYNVLEDPRSLNEPLEGREAPCYQVLEGPFSEDTPVYNVLEQPPSSDNPVYKSLEGRNPSVYSTLNRGNDTKGAAKQARNYNDTVYDCVGKVINDTTDIYQELNQNDQMNKDVYQALDNSDTTLRLNQLELTSHSNA